MPTAPSRGVKVTQWAMPSTTSTVIAPAEHEPLAVPPAAFAAFFDALEAE